jgi:hypothetical protein
MLRDARRRGSTGWFWIGSAGHAEWITCTFWSGSQDRSPFKELLFIFVSSETLSDLRGINGLMFFFSFSIDSELLHDIWLLIPYASEQPLAGPPVIEY